MVVSRFGVSVRIGSGGKRLVPTCTCRDALTCTASRGVVAHTGINRMNNTYAKRLTEVEVVGNPELTRHHVILIQIPVIIAISNYSRALSLESSQGLFLVASLAVQPAFTSLY